MDLRRVLGETLYKEAREYSDRVFGAKKLAMLVRIAVAQYLKERE